MFVCQRDPLKFKYKTNIKDLSGHELNFFFSSSSSRLKETFNSDLTICPVRYQLNHEFVQKVILSREIRIASYQERCEEKRGKNKATLNATIILKLVECKASMHRS